VPAQAGPSAAVSAWCNLLGLAAASDGQGAVDSGWLCAIRRPASGLLRGLRSSGAALDVIAGQGSGAQGTTDSKLLFLLGESCGVATAASHRLQLWPVARCHVHQPASTYRRSLPGKRTHESRRMASGDHVHVHVSALAAQAGGLPH